MQEREITYRNLLAAYLKLQDVSRRNVELEKRLQEVAATPEPVDRRCKLRPEQVSEIRRAYDAGEASMHKLAKRYRVSVSTVSNIVHGFYWKNLSAETFAL